MDKIKLDMPDIEAAKIAANFVPNSAYAAAVRRVIEIAEKAQQDADNTPKAPGTITVLNSYLRRYHERLVKFTKGACPDFHEPDEQGFTAKVYGDSLDNAMGDNPQSNCGEMTVGLTREGEKGKKKTEYFNLATLIALAREAK